MSDVTTWSETISELHGIVKRSRRALLTGPVEVDGDSIGATLALASILERANPALEVVAVSAIPLPRRYRFLDGSDRFVPPSAVSGDFDLAFLLDGVRHRIGEVGPTFDAATVRVLVDHHISSDPADYDMALLDSHRASTCDIVYDVARHPRFDVPVDRAMAAQLYTGIAFDTGVFRYSCTTPGTFRLAAELLETGIDAQQIVERVFLDAEYDDTIFRGRVMSDIRLAGGGKIAYACVPHTLREETRATPAATEGLINSLIFVEGVEVAALLNERKGGVIKLSFRSRGRVNVAQVASSLHPEGGGHDRASGVTLRGSMDEVLQRVLAEVTPRLPA